MLNLNVVWNGRKKKKRRHKLPKSGMKEKASL